jgi:hypothetical protein
LANIYDQWVPTEQILCTNLWKNDFSKLVAIAFQARWHQLDQWSILSNVTKATPLKAAVWRDSDFMQPGMPIFSIKGAG